MCRKRTAPSPLKKTIYPIESKYVLFFCSLQNTTRLRVPARPKTIRGPRTRTTVDRRRTCRPTTLGRAGTRCNGTANCRRRRATSGLGRARRISGSRRRTPRRPSTDDGRLATAGVFGNEWRSVRWRTWAPVVALRARCGRPAWRPGSIRPRRPRRCIRRRKRWRADGAGRSVLPV